MALDARVQHFLCPAAKVQSSCFLKADQADEPSAGLEILSLYAILGAFAPGLASIAAYHSLGIGRIAS
jgi:hypothetical protein